MAFNIIINTIEEKGINFSKLKEIEVISSLHNSKVKYMEDIETKVHYIMKSLTINMMSSTFKDDEELIKNEIYILEKIMKQPAYPKIMPIFLGHIIHEFVDYKEYHILYEFKTTWNMKDFIEKKKKTFSLKQLLFFFKELIIGFSFLQLNKIVHRDIKPSNILIKKSNETKEYSLVIIDFGISKDLTEMSIADIFDIPPIIVRQKSQYVMSIIGTPTYFSPEMRNASNNNSSQIFINPYKSDVYSLGLTMLYFSTGNSFPPDTENLDETVNKVMSKFSSEITKINNKEDENDHKLLFSLLSCCLLKDPLNRPDFLNLFWQFIQSDEQDLLKHILFEEESLNIRKKSMKDNIPKAKKTLSN